MWHPGPQDQKINRCVPDAINMYFGGPIYDTMDKFFEYYTYNMRMKKDWVPEDIALRGVSLVNLHNLVVVREDSVTYNTRSAGTIDRFLIDIWMKSRGWIADMIMQVLLARSIIQHVSYGDLEEGEDRPRPTSSHAACLFTYEN